MIGSYLVDGITLRMYKGADEWQETISTTDVALRGFIDYNEQRVENASGEMVMAMATVLMRPRDLIVNNFSTRESNTISYKDKIVFPDGSVHGIMRIHRQRDFTIRSMKVYVR